LAQALCEPTVPSALRSAGDRDMGCTHSGKNCPVRTSLHTNYKVVCTERPFQGPDPHYPVKLVVFDLDETLTLATFMPDDLSLPQYLHAEYTTNNFESPWVEGSRVTKLKTMLTNISTAADGTRRTLAVLTRNEAGVATVFRLLDMVGLTAHLSAIWDMPLNSIRDCGMYKDGGAWKFYRPPGTPRDHKVDVLHRITQSPVTWFPQLSGKEKAAFEHLEDIRLEGILLVDDQKSSFSSPSGLTVLRCCKVAHYDAMYRGYGFITDMGGIGARAAQDYDRLERFVEAPWMWRETMSIKCGETVYPTIPKKCPVNLVVFGFDETLTIATFMPKEPACATLVGWCPSGSSKGGRLKTDDLVIYNFETPFLDGSRVAMLKHMLEALREESVTLAVLTKNPSGAVAVLNLLKLAGLAECFSAVWAMPSFDRKANGVYQDDDGIWKAFDFPPSAKHEYKADVLLNIVEEPCVWFPQMRASGVGGHDEPARAGAGNIQVSPKGMEGIVLVDDERASFGTDKLNNKVLRFCKVPRYDDFYRECGYLNQMGGIGARDHLDYSTLVSFVKACNQGKKASEISGSPKEKHHAVYLDDMQTLPHPSEEPQLVRL